MGLLISPSYSGYLDHIPLYLLVRSTLVPILGECVEGWICHKSISGFNHIHAWTMGGLRMMSATADLVFNDRTVDSAFKGAGANHHSSIKKETE